MDLSNWTVESAALCDSSCDHPAEAGAVHCIHCVVLTVLSITLALYCYTLQGVLYPILLFVQTVSGSFVTLLKCRMGELAVHTLLRSLEAVLVVGAQLYCTSFK